jgi:phage tail-like protein
MAETGQREDPYRAYNFLVDIDGVAVAGFREVSGLSGDSAVISYREGTDPVLTVRKLPGQSTWGDLTLIRGMTKSRVLWQWRLTTLQGATERRNGSILLRDEQQRTVAEWRWENGWLSRYQGATLNATANEVAIETVVIAHEGLYLV